LTPLTSESWYGMVVDHAVSRSVRDTALLLDLTHGVDPLSPYAAREPKGFFAVAAAREPGKLSLAVYRKSPLGLPISAETLQALDTAVALAREGGHTVEEIDLPFIGRDFMADFCKTVAS
ncbi:amidase, partial [Mesorhizobium sp. M1C.F.Ca.ET.189.01.1.1]